MKKKSGVKKKDRGTHARARTVPSEEGGRILSRFTIVFSCRFKTHASIHAPFSRTTPDTHGWCGPDAVVVCLPSGMAFSEHARYGNASPWHLP